MNKLGLSLFLALVLALLTFSIQAQDDLPDVVNFRSEGLLPEGVEWDATRGLFLVSSQADGLIQTVDDDGTLTALIEDDDLIFSNGIHIDTAGNRLLVTTTDVEPILDCDALRQEQAFTGVAVYDLETLERLALYDLSDVYPNFGSMTNDVTVDTDGNIYATDWCGSGIAKIDVDGNIMPLVTGESFYVSAPGFGAGAFNGIDWHPDGYLLVSGGYGTTLYKIILTTPSIILPGPAVSITPVVLDVEGFADGVTILENGDVVIIGIVLDPESEAGFSNATARYTSDDDFATATLTGAVTYERFATTGVVRDGAFYSVFAGIGEALKDTTVGDYEILRIDFDADATPEMSREERLRTVDLFNGSTIGSIYSSQVEALLITGLDDVLFADEPFTLLTTSDAGFRQLARELGMTVEEMFADVELLTEILSYHFIPYEVAEGDVGDGAILETLHGDTLTVDYDSNTNIYSLLDNTGHKVRVGAVTVWDNGLFYYIGNLMIPLSE